MGKDAIWLVHTAETDQPVQLQEFELSFLITDTDFLEDIHFAYILITITAPDKKG